MNSLRYMLIGLVSSLSTLGHADGRFHIQASGNISPNAVNLTITNDTAIAYPNTNVFLRGLSVSGTIVKNSPEYVVRVILKDINGHEYLVMETYEELCSDDTIHFSGHAEETSLLNCIKADSVIVYVNDAILQLDSINSCSVLLPRLMMPAAYNSRMENIREQQVQAKVDMINAYNDTHDRYWWAGVTELSLMSNEDKRRVLNLSANESSGGIEYYAGGFFEIGSRNINNQTPSSKYVESFDWRNRHGKNWLTPPKNQKKSGFCTVFSLIGCVESLIKLYFNRDEDFDLSEQKIVCACGNDSSWWKGVSWIKTLRYLENQGVCEESAYPFLNVAGQNCRSDSLSPLENVKISGHRNFTVPYNKDRLKDSLIHYGPLDCGFTRRNVEEDHTWGHAVPLVGYGTVHAGDSIQYHDGNHLESWKVIPDDSPLVGKTYWIFRNSYGEETNSHDGINGYINMVFNNYSRMHSPTILSTPILTSTYGDSDIVVEDSDGDGYYFWGIGPKPAHAPAGIPDEPDGDDSNADYGPMNKYGYLKVLNPNVADTLMVNDSITIDNTEYLYNHIQVNSNGVLTVETDTEFWGELKLTVKNGGTLIVDGIIMDNTELSLESGGHLIVRNGGTLKLRSGKSFYAPIGAVVDISSGNILP